jgi:hypothetical protein
VPTKEQRDLVSIMAGVGRPHREIATLVINPRTGKAIDDVTLRVRFPEELSQAKAKVSLIVANSLVGKAGAGDNGALAMLARNHWGWDRPGLKLAVDRPYDPPAAEDADGEIRIVLIRSPERDEDGNPV